MSETKLEDLNLHDSEILSIAVRFVEPGLRQVDVILDYIEEYQPVRTSKKVLRFLDCYKLLLDLNLDIVAPESILDGSIIEQSPVVEGLDEELRKIGGFVPRSLKHFRIRTNSSGGTVDVLSTGLSLVDVQDAGIPGPA